MLDLKRIFLLQSLHIHSERGVDSGAGKSGRYGGNWGLEIWGWGMLKGAMAQVWPHFDDLANAQGISQLLVVDLIWKGIAWDRLSQLRKNHPRAATRATISSTGARRPIPS
jgi:hypothetical protein